MDKKLVIITGMHRSGTSALAQLIAASGWDAGGNLMPADDDNPKGYFEDFDIFRLNNKLLSHLFLRWDQVEEFDKRRINLYHQKLIKLFAQEAVDIFVKKFKESDLILVKDPRFSILMPFWDTVFNQLKVEVTHYHIIRNPLSVAKSLKKRNQFPVRNGLMLYYYYNLSFLIDIRRPFLVVQYEELISNQGIISSTLYSTENLKTAGVNISTNTIEPGLNHYPALDSELHAESAFFPAITLLYKYLHELAGHRFSTINHKDLLIYIKSGISTHYKQTISSTIHVNLVIPSGSSGHPNRIFKQQFVEKEDAQVFELVDEAIRSDRFSIYIGDRPARVKFNNVLVKTSVGTYPVNPSGGTYALQQNAEFYFLTNQPEFAFSLEKQTIIEQITIAVEVNDLDFADLSMLFPELNTDIAELKQTVQILSDQIQGLKSKNKLHHNTINDQNKEIKRYLQDISDREAKIIGYEQKIEDQHTEIDILEKKSFWLYTEFNKLKGSLSWKITTPLRWFQKGYAKLQNRLVILINDAGASYRLLLREGLITFLYRLKWYIRGKRLKEEIENRRIQGQTGFQTEERDFNLAGKLYFKSTDNPQVSIIIPVNNHVAITQQCLQSIYSNTTKISYEIIVVDDQSTDQTKILENIIGGIQIIRNEENLGFLKSCNKGAEKAGGKYICLLNNDTQVQRGWLNKLVAYIETHEDVGIVGPKLVYPDGRLQEAGGIIWDDATGWNFGKFTSAEMPDCNYVKEVDYVSGACLLIRNKLWEKLNGFDVDYSPAYYEDTDLAFRVRQLNYKVVYQPAATVIHYEGYSHGINEKSGLKKHQATNLKKFYLKWNHELKVASSPNGNHVFFHRDRSLQKKHLLVIDHYVPMYDQDAGSRSTFGYLKLFVKMGFQVHFIGDNFYKHEPYTSALQQMGIEVLYGSHYQKNIRSWFRENGKYIDLIIAHRVHIAPKYFGMIKKFTRARVAYVGHDLQYLTNQRQFEITGNKAIRKSTKMFKKTEYRIFNFADMIFPFSTYEAPFIKSMAPDKIVQPIPVYFFNGGKKQAPGFHKRKDILFVGYFGHPPNPDAVIWFVKEIFPLVIKSIPDAGLYIVGSHPTEEVKKLEDENITVTGYVTDEKLNELYSECRVSVLPLRFGAGVKGKLLESFNHGLPPVITSIAAEGVPDIEDHALIADKPADFAEKIRLLYQDENVWGKYSAVGKALIEKHYTEEAARSILEKVFKNMISKTSGTEVLI